MKTAIRITALCCISLGSVASPYRPLKSPYTNTSRFPVLNWNDYQSKDTQRKQRFIRKLGVALRDYGFFALINHPVSKHTLQPIALAMGEPHYYFATYQKHTSSILRVIHYKAKTGHTEKHILHKAPHNVHAAHQRILHCMANHD